MSLIAELKRRNVFRVGVAYAIGAWVIAQVADLVLDNIEAPDWVMQAIMLVLAIGLPLALIVAWAFELTPEGFKREAEVDRTESITHVTGRKLDFAIIGLLVIAVAYFAVDKFVLEAEPEQTETTANPPSSNESAIPDLAKASVVHRALSLTDLDIARAVLTEGDSRVRGAFDITTLESRDRLYTPVTVQINEEVSPNIFLTASVWGDSNISTLELRGLDVHFLIANRTNSYMIYSSEENQTTWKPLPVALDQNINTLGLHQVDRRVTVFLNSQPVDSFNLWNTPDMGRVGLFFKANPVKPGHGFFRGLAVYEFRPDREE